MGGRKSLRRQNSGPGRKGVWTEIGKGRPGQVILGFSEIWEQSDGTVHIHCHWRTVDKCHALVLVAWWDLSH